MSITVTEVAIRTAIYSIQYLVDTVILAADIVK